MAGRKSSHLIRSLGENFITDSLEKLNNQRKEGTFCDLMLRCKNGEELKVHKVVLCSRSDYFTDMLTSCMKESTSECIEYQNLSSKTLELILSFIYLGELTTDDVNEIENIIEHAYCFRLTKLVEICGLFLEKYISKKNCLKFWRLGEQFKLKKLADACIDFILSSDDGKLYLNLLYDFTVEEMKKILASDKLPGSEEEIYEATLKWAKKISTVEQGFLTILSEVVDFIRFPLMKMPYFLFKVLSNEDLFEDKDLRKRISETGKNNERSECNRPLLSNNAAPRIGLRKKGFLVINGRKIFTLSKKGELHDMQSCASKVMAPHFFGYSTFGNNFLLTCGGLYTNTNRIALPTHHCEYFSSITKEWKGLPHMLHSRGSHSCAFFDNKIYACGGVKNKTVEIFNLDRIEWNEGPSLTKQRECFGLSTLNGALYAVGGWSDSGDNLIEMFDPRSEKWSIVARNSDCISSARCASIGNEIYFFSNNQGWAYDVRNQSIRIWVHNDKISASWNYFDICELNGEIGLFGRATKEDFVFDMYNSAGQNTFSYFATKENIGTTFGTALVSLCY